MLRLTFVLVGAVLVVGQVHAGVAAQAPPDPSLDARRAVAVVFDDSGSMDDDAGGNGAWRYANYALQTLVALLAEDDQLSVIRMSDPARAVPVDLSDRAGAVSAIRGESHPNASTPYQGVFTAMDVLRASPIPSRWLIVISDGAFEDVGLDEATLRQQIRDFVGVTGTRSVFLLIGDTPEMAAAVADQPLVRVWPEEVQTTIHQAVGRADIVAQMEQIALDITSRSAGAGPHIDWSGDTLTVHSDFPLRRLTLLDQESSSADVGTTESASAGGSDLDVASIDVGMPAGSIEAIEGRVTHLRHPNAARGQIVPAGDIRLDFADGARAANVRLLPEVAAQLIVALFDGSGREVPVDGSSLTLCVDDTYVVRAALVDPDGNPLTLGVSDPHAIDVHLVRTSGEEALALDAARAYFEIRMQALSGRDTLSVSAAYPGYFAFRSSLLTVEASVCNPPRSISLEPREPWQAYGDEIGRTDPLSALPLADGAPVDAAEFDPWSLTIVDDGGLALDVTKDVTGTQWLLAPRPPFLNLAFLGPVGDFDVAVEVSSGRSNEPSVREVLRFRVLDPPWWRKWGVPLVLLLGILLALWWLLGMLIKPRFPKGALIEYREQDAHAWGIEPHISTHLLRVPLWRRWLVPYRADRKVVEGVTFRAARENGVIFVPRQQQGEGMFLAGMPLEPPYRDERLMDGDVLEIPGSDGVRRSYQFVNPRR